MLFLRHRLERTAAGLLALALALAFCLALVGLASDLRGGDSHRPGGWAGRIWLDQPTDGTSVAGRIWLDQPAEQTTVLAGRIWLDEPADSTT